jgi:hypothetical protein
MLIISSALIIPTSSIGYVSIHNIYKMPQASITKPTNPYQETLDETAPVAPIIGPFLLLLSILTLGKVYIFISISGPSNLLYNLQLYTQEPLLISRVSRVYDTGNGCVYKPFVRPQSGQDKDAGSVNGSCYMSYHVAAYLGIAILASVSVLDS